MSLKEPKSLALPFALSSLLFLVLLAVSPVKDYLSEWRRFQKEYNRSIAALPVKVKPVVSGVRQIWIENLGVTDRCTTCHLGTSDVRMATLPQPFRSHPPMYHDPEEFGCTPCHRGQGIATTVTESVGQVEFWNEPMLPAEYSEAGCGTCHQGKVVPDAPVLSRGRELLEQYRCAGCHTIPDVAPDYSISLNGLGRKVNREWLVQWLKAPQETVGNSRMPAFHFTDAQIDDLADFLLTAEKPHEGAPWEPLPKVLKEDFLDDEILIRQGARRFREARCISCHPINGRGGSLATDLGTVASKVNPAWLYNYIRNPQKLSPGVPMPHYGFTPEDAAAVTAYILSEFIDWDREEPAGEAHVPSPDHFQRGRQVFNDFNCLGCHSLSAKGVTRNMGPDLSGIGNKPLVELEFGQAEIIENRWSFVTHKLENPRQFLDNARMPYFGFDDRELRSVTTALLALQDNRASSIKHFAATRSVAIPMPQGQVGQLVERYACLSCHTMGGEGYLLASDLTREGSRVKPAWLHDYFQVPYTLRPILTERMPNLFMSADEIDLISDYINLVYVDDELDQVQLSLDNKSAIETGRKLVHEVYGCQACHQVKGAGGYVGPPLDITAQRSKPTWIYAWIRNPQRYRPDTIDPNQGLTDEEAKAITAYIVSLGEGAK